MKSVATKGATHNYQPPENWEVEKHGECSDLSVRVELYHGVQDMVSTWKPDAADLAALNAGGVLELHLLGAQPPVMIVAVAPEVEPAKSPITINETAHGFDSAYP